MLQLGPRAAQMLERPLRQVNAHNPFHRQSPGAAPALLCRCDSAPPRPECDVPSPLTRREKPATAKQQKKVPAALRGDGVRSRRRLPLRLPIAVAEIRARAVAGASRSLLPRRNSAGLLG